jgi:hypothetical protein
MAGLWLRCCTVILFIAVVLSCKLSGGWACRHGRIIAMDFGIADDDDTFELIANVNTSCTMFQQGTYRIHDREISVDISSANCDITGETTSACNCYSDFTMSIDELCLDITGPNGEHCTQLPGNDGIRKAFMFLNCFH